MLLELGLPCFSTLLHKDWLIDWRINWASLGNIRVLCCQPQKRRHHKPSCWDSQVTINGDHCLHCSLTSRYLSLTHDFSTPAVSGPGPYIRFSKFLAKVFPIKVIDISRRQMCHFALKFSRLYNVWRPYSARTHRESSECFPSRFYAMKSQQKKQQESPADERVTRDSAVILRWRLFQDGGQPPSWILSNQK